MRLFSTRLQTGVIMHMHLLVNQLDIMRIEGVGIPGVFFRRIQSMVICSVQEFVKACSVCFGSSVHNYISSGVSLDFASSVCFGFARRIARFPHLLAMRSKESCTLIYGRAAMGPPSHPPGNDLGARHSDRPAWARGDGPFLPPPR